MTLNMTMTAAITTITIIMIITPMVTMVTAMLQRISAYPLPSALV